MPDFMLKYKAYAKELAQNFDPHITDSPTESEL
jgi:hypothetical protein